MTSTDGMFDPNDGTSPGRYGSSETALILIDFHARFVQKAGGPRAPDTASVAAKMRAWARSQKIQVYHCLLDVDQDPLPAMKGAQRYASVMKVMRTHDGGSESTSELAKDAADDMTFTRRPGYGSVFYSPGLTENLQTRGIKSLVITGLPTSGAVARTAFAASDAGYVVTIISDACADPDSGVHDIMMSDVLGARGWVSKAAQFQEGFEAIRRP